MCDCTQRKRIKKHYMVLTDDLTRTTTHSLKDINSLEELFTTNMMAPRFINPSKLGFSPGVSLLRMESCTPVCMALLAG